MEMASEGRPLMQRVLPEGEIHWWRHYPENDARDRVTRARWYYHVHAPGQRIPQEHGHFHLFLHKSRIDDEAVPLAAPKAGDNAKALVTHLAGLSIDRQGVPLAWFCTNRWVTDEFMYPAETMSRHLDGYNVDHTEEDSTVDRFITAMVAIYRDELCGLLKARDARLAELGAAPTRPEVYERENDILSSLPIDLDAKVESLGLE